MPASRIVSATSFSVASQARATAFMRFSSNTVCVIERAL